MAAVDRADLGGLQRFGRFAGGSLQGADGSGLGSFRQKAPLAVLVGAMAAGGRVSSFGGRGRGFGISGLRQQLWGQGARLRHLRSPSAALQAAAVALRRRSHCPLPPKQLP